MSFWEYLGATLLGGGTVSVIFGALTKAWLSTQLERFKADLSVTSRLEAQSVERRATIAAQVLVCTLRYLDALRSSTTPGAQVATQPSATPAAFLKAEFEARWAVLREYEKQFGDACVQAEVYLSDGVSGFLEEIADYGNELYANQITHLTMLHNGGGHDQTYFENSIGRRPRARIKELRDGALANLRPLIKLGRASRGECAELPNMALNATGAGAPAR